MAEFTLSGRLKVKTLKAQFKASYGSTLRVYNNISCDGTFADDNATLASIRAFGHRGGDFDVRGNMLVGNFEKKVAELFGIGVQVASPDDKYLVDNSMSLTASGRIENKEVSKEVTEQEAEKEQLSGRKQRIRVEIQIAEHDYAAFDADGSMVGDTYAFNGDDGYEELKLYIDDEEYDFGDEAPGDVIRSKYSDYEKFDLEQEWADEEVDSIGYYDNMAFLTWEFDVVDFDINKLTINYDCNDVCYEPADYEVESRILSLSYDGEEIDTSSYECSDGDLETIWYNEEEDDYDEEEDYDNEEDEAYIENEPKEKTIKNGHEYVDLGLPSGLKWATCNVGASSPEEYGGYYAWGETKTKKEYTEKNYNNYGKDRNDISGSTRYDAARANWGGSWRLPTKEEFDELHRCCKFTWTTLNGIKGYSVKGLNGNSIFLPAAGYRDGSPLGYEGYFGHYWSSTPHGSFDDYAYYLGFGSDEEGVYRDYRGNGHTVRPITE